MNAYREHDMIILTAPLPAIDAVDTPVSPLNAIWYGDIPHRMSLPRLGHAFIVCPLGETILACANTVIDSSYYLFLTDAAPDQPYRLDPLPRADDDARLLLLMLSPAFIAEMADFLGIPFDMTHLLHAVPLPQGDTLSQVLRLMAGTLHDSEQTEELFMEAVGQILRLLRLRHQTLVNLAHHADGSRQLFDTLPHLEPERAGRGAGLSPHQ
ncbi:MAG TPA: hypothetical protein PLD47_12305 [Aggregatilineales bacterium]|nr:hypothetical protein [Anaerolineales bacterium]HRE48498.1 hypothetical protein [Aggregatilineales bacterium]